MEDKQVSDDLQAQIALEQEQREGLLKPEHLYSEGEEVIILSEDGRSDQVGKVVSVSGTAHVGFMYEVVYEARNMFNEKALSKVE